ncbi:MAG: hypothetical protein WC861_06900 [Candidatus Micrarchaeia archaeon]
MLQIGCQVIVLTRVEASSRFNYGRDYAKAGAEAKEDFRLAKNRGDIPLARDSLNCAIKSYGNALQQYRFALGESPCRPFEGKIIRKMDGLKKCDLKFVQKALEKVRLQLEPPMANELQ